MRTLNLEIAHWCEDIIQGGNKQKNVNNYVHSILIVIGVTVILVQWRSCSS